MKSLFIRIENCLGFIPTKYEYNGSILKILVKIKSIIENHVQVINKTLQNKLLDKLKEVKSEARDD
jgi:hypothetical protein